MAIKLKLSAGRIPSKAVGPSTVSDLAKQCFDRWQAGIQRGDGSLISVALESYFNAVSQLGFKGHIGKWVDAILAAGDMTMADFPDAPGQRS